LLLYGTAELQSGTLSLTGDITFSGGRGLYKDSHKIPPNSSKLLSFSSSFTFSITPYNNSPPGNGFAFILVPSLGIEGAS
jgi:hypothetical protein